MSAPSISSRLRVFAVEPTAAQLTWRRLPIGMVTLTGAGPDVHIDSDGRPGAVDVTELTPATDYTVHVRTGRSGTPVDRVRFRTPRPPPGQELFRLATMSDLHLGRESFGFLDRMRPAGDHDREIHWLCSVSAVDAAVSWGASRLVFKGDLVDHGTQEEWATAAELVDHALDAGLDVDVIAGNHEAKWYREVDREPAMREHDIEWTDGARALDLDGFRLVLIDTAWDDHHRGRLDHATTDLDDLIEHHRTLVALHHFPQPMPIPYFWPPTVGWRESRRFLDALDDRAPGALVTAGHSHRHRRRHHGSLTITEVGSAKDYPGTWAGYVVYEGGIRQVVRRVAGPESIAWTEYTRLAALGFWQHWSPGRMTDRCFSIDWAG